MQTNTIMVFLKREKLNIILYPILLVVLIFFSLPYIRTHPSYGPKYLGSMLAIQNVVTEYAKSNDGYFPDSKTINIMLRQLKDAQKLASDGLNIYIVQYEYPPQTIEDKKIILWAEGDGKLFIMYSENASFRTRVAKIVK